MKLTQYPFAALVAQEQLQLALLLCAVDPSLGGVLICGEKGTAKSTAARALADLLPPIRSRAGCPCHSSPDEPSPFLSDDSVSLAGDVGHVIEQPAPFVELPLGATEDRVIGTLDFEQAVRDRRQVLQPGLLATANRGVLYIDEVNLLPDHLMDLLLDVAASGVNVVEREGVRASHPARFILLGTMNPEEGHLRPQLLDRFGLTVSLTAPREPATRVEVLRRRMAFDANPAGFQLTWEQQQTDLRRTICDARERLSSVQTSDETLHQICQLCCELQVEGLRGDIAVQKAARALAAFEQRREVTTDDVRRAAALALPHRRRRQPFEQPGLDHCRLDELLPPEQSPTNPPESRPAPDLTNSDETTDASSSEAGEQCQDGDGSRDGNGATVAAVTQGFPAPPVRLADDKPWKAAMAGRRNRTQDAPRGRFVRAIPDASGDDLAVAATIRSAAKNELGENGELDIRPTDLHRKQRVGEAGTLILFVVDASGSMAARQRMELVKSVIVTLLQDAYQQRDRVGMIAFRGANAELILPPTRGVELAQQALASLPTGGRTPLAHALSLAAQTIQSERRSADGLLALVVLVTDGKTNVTLPKTDGDPWAQTVQASAALNASHPAVLLLDADQEYVRVGRARELAQLLHAEYRPLDGFTAETLAIEIRSLAPAQIQSVAMKQG